GRRRAPEAAETEAAETEAVAHPAPRIGREVGDRWGRVSRASEAWGAVNPEPADIVTAGRVEVCPARPRQLDQASAARAAWEVVREIRVRLGSGNRSDINPYISL